MKSTSNTKYCAIINSLLDHSLLCYSMVPDCAHRQNKNIMGIFCETTTQMKNTLVEIEKPTPYKSLTGHFLKNVAQIKPTGGMHDLITVALLM